MAEIITDDISIYKDGSWRSIKEQQVYSNGWKTIGNGSGVYCNGNWYVFNEDSRLLLHPNSTFKLTFDHIEGLIGSVFTYNGILSSGSVPVSALYLNDLPEEHINRLSTMKYLRTIGYVIGTTSYTVTFNTPITTIPSPAIGQIKIFLFNSSDIDGMKRFETNFSDWVASNTKGYLITFGITENVANDDYPLMIERA